MTRSSPSAAASSCAAWGLRKCAARVGRDELGPRAVGPAPDREPQCELTFAKVYRFTDRDVGWALSDFDGERHAVGERELGPAVDVGVALLIQVDVPADVLVPPDRELGGAAERGVVRAARPADADADRGGPAGRGVSDPDVDEEGHASRQWWERPVRAGDR